MEKLLPTVEAEVSKTQSKLDAYLKSKRTT